MMHKNKKFKSFHNLNSSTVEDIAFDLAIYACGYEVRSSSLLERDIKIRKKIALTFKNTNGKQFKENLRKFKNYGFQIEEVGVKSFEKIFNILNGCLTDFNSDSLPVKILIDYSSMTRYWYATIINFFKYVCKYDVDLYFIYNKALYKPTSFDDVEIEVEPMDFISRVSYPEKPIALIICLGDQLIQSAGLKEYYDAEQVYYFYADNENSERILEINKSIIENDRNLIPFVFDDLSSTRYLLDKLVEKLKMNYRVVIAPCGPKPFSLVSLIIASFSYDVDVWRIGLKSPKMTNRKAEPKGETVVNYMTLRN